MRHLPRSITFHLFPAHDEKENKNTTTRRHWTVNENKRRFRVGGVGRRRKENNNSNGPHDHYVSRRRSRKGAECVVVSLLLVNPPLFSVREPREIQSLRQWQHSGKKEQKKKEKKSWFYSSLGSILTSPSSRIETKRWSSFEKFSFFNKKTRE